MCVIRKIHKCSNRTKILSKSSQYFCRSYSNIKIGLIKLQNLTSKFKVLIFSDEWWRLVGCSYHKFNQIFILGINIKYYSVQRTKLGYQYNFFQMSRYTIKKKVGVIPNWEPYVNVLIAQVNNLPQIQYFMTKQFFILISWSESIFLIYKNLFF